MKIIAVVMLKGGVGKTTTTSNLAGALASRGNRVLLVDYDAQCNLTSAVGAQAERGTVVDSILDGRPFSDILVDTQLTETVRLSIVPGDRRLRDTEKDLYIRKHMAGADAPLEHRAPSRILARRLAEVDSEFDYALIDCPPSLDLLTGSALVAADIAIAPCQTATESLQGLVETVRAHRELRGLRERRLYILRTFCDRTRHSRESAGEVATHFPAETLHTTIKSTVDFKDASNMSLPLTCWRPNNDGAQCYFEALDEILRREAGQTAVARAEQSAEVMEATA